MSWISTIPVVVLTLALLFVPGGLVAFALGLRGLSAASTAPALTVTITAVTAIVSPYLGLRWSAAPVLVVSALLAAVTAGIRRLVNRRVHFRGQPTAWTPSWAGSALTAGFLIGAGLIVSQLIRAFSAPDHISQTFDNIFHLNAVRYILDTGSASSLTLTSMTSGDQAPYFYPAAWHGIVALIVELSGTPISVAVNVANICIAAAVWPIGCMLLTRVVVGKRTLPVMAAGVLSAGFSAFPILLLDYGVLYPNFLALCLLPVGLAAVVVFFNATTALSFSPFTRFALIGLIAPGIAVAHPNGLMSLIAFSVPVILYAYWRRFVAGRQFMDNLRASILASAGLAVLLGIFVIMWKYIRPPVDAAFWDKIQSPARAIFQVITNSALDRPVSWTVSILMALGLIALAWQRKQLWLVSCFILTGALFVIVSGVSFGYLRSLITGVWYNDSYRVAALLPLTAVPLAAAGLDWLARKLAQLAIRIEERHSATRLGQVSSYRQRTVLNAISGALLLAVAVSSQGAGMGAAVADARKHYAETAKSEVLTTDELALISKLDALVPADDVIAVNPWTGGALAYALAQRNTTAKHILTTYTGAEEVINQKLRDALIDPSVCPAVKATGVRYVLDFGTQEVHYEHHDFPGLDNLRGSPAFTLAGQVGQAKLYRLNACS